jgi:hypothetical protein
VCKMSANAAVAASKYDFCIRTSEVPDRNGGC